MVRFKDRDVRKLSPGKITLAGKKQVFRKRGSHGRNGGDLIGVRDETIEDSQPLLRKVMENGSRLYTSPTLQEIQNQFKQNFSSLEEKYKNIHATQRYPVKLSSRLKALQERR